MYRKIIFIFFTILTTIPNEQKTIILLFVSAGFLHYTLKNRPFVVQEMNMLEIQSNLTAMITIFSGSLYILNVSDIIKASTFTSIILINTFFAVKWFFSTLDAVLYFYGGKINRFCPCLLNYYAIYKKTNEITKFSWKLHNYIYKFMRNFIYNQRNFALIKQYNTNSLKNQQNSLNPQEIKILDKARTKESGSFI